MDLKKGLGIEPKQQHFNVLCILWENVPWLLVLDITELEGLFSLRGSPVEVLQLEGNPVCQIGGLREKLVNVLPYLTTCSCSWLH